MDWVTQPSISQLTTIIMVRKVESGPVHDKMLLVLIFFLNGKFKGSRRQNGRLHIIITVIRMPINYLEQPILKKLATKVNTCKTTYFTHVFLSRAFRVHNLIFDISEKSSFLSLLSIREMDKTRMQAFQISILRGLLKPHTPTFCTLMPCTR